MYNTTGVMIIKKSDLIVTNNKKEIITETTIYITMLAKVSLCGVNNCVTLTKYLAKDTIIIIIFYTRNDHLIFVVIIMSLYFILPRI